MILAISPVISKLLSLIVLDSVLFNTIAETLVELM